MVGAAFPEPLLLRCIYINFKTQRIFLLWLRSLGEVLDGSISLMSPVQKGEAVTITSVETCNNAPLHLSRPNSDNQQPDCSSNWPLKI